MKFIGSILSSTGSNTFEYDSRCFHSRYSDADRERRIRKPPGGPAKAFFINSSGTHVTLSNVVGFSRRTHGGDTRTAPGFPARLTHVSLLVAYLPDNADSLNGNLSRQTARRAFSALKCPDDSCCQCRLVTS